MNTSLASASIIAHLGGEDFLTGLGARDFVVDDTCLSFTLVHGNPKGIHSVAISIDPHGTFKVTCCGRITPGSLHAPVLGRANVAIPENLATVLGELTGIDTLRHRHL
jgi:hypothetical protein